MCVLLINLLPAHTEQCSAHFKGCFKEISFTLPPPLSSSYSSHFPRTLLHVSLSPSPFFWHFSRRNKMGEKSLKCCLCLGLNALGPRPLAPPSPLVAGRVIADVCAHKRAASRSVASPRVESRRLASLCLALPAAGRGK